MRGRLAALLALAAVVHVPAALAGSVGVSTSIEPQPSRLGDVIHATLTVHADGAVTVAEGFAPFQVISSSSSRTTREGVVQTTWRFELQCLQAQCAPGPTARKVSLAPSTVRVGSSSVTAHFPTVTVVPRVTAYRVAHPASSFLHPLTAPAPGYRFSPTSVRRVLFSAAAVLVVLALVLLVPVVRPRRARRAAPAVDPLARALALVRAARTRPPPDRRRALGLLSRTVRTRVGPEDLSRDVADLAWSRPEPQPEAMTKVADRVEGAE
jgi:hypothetical protein